MAHAFVANNELGGIGDFVGGASDAQDALGFVQNMLLNVQSVFITTFLGSSMES
jgi:hypothetical protein